jgi:hypothetical protein
MTDRTRDAQLTNSNQEAIDLNELHASKATQALRSEVSQVANTDLASASIQSISVVRLSARPEKRKLTAPLLAPTDELSQTTEPQKNTSTRPRANKTIGVLKNPYYKYEGNVLERCITLFANLLKVIEHALLKSFKPQLPVPPPSPVVVKTKRRGPDGREIDEETEATRDRDPEHIKLPQE